MSKDEAIILRSGKTHCRIMFEMQHTIGDGLPGVLHQKRFPLNVLGFEESPSQDKRGFCVIHARCSRCSMRACAACVWTKRLDVSA